MTGDDAVLVIDDDLEVTQTLRDFLVGEGHTVAVAHTGADGLRRIREGGVGLVLLDLLLPDTKGGDVMREALRAPAPPEFIIVTGHATLDSAIEAVEESAAGYLPKPVDFPRLGAIVRRVFERRRLLRENERLQAERLSAERRFEEILHAAPDAMIVVDEQGRIELVNSRAEDMFGYPRGELLGRSVDTLVPDRYRHLHAEHRAGYARAPVVRAMGARAELAALRRDGTEFPAEIGLSPLTAGQGMRAVASIRDVTERREIEEERRRASAEIGELYERAERDRRRLEVLNEVSRRLAAVHEQEEVLSLIVNEAARLLRAEASGLRLVEGDDLVVGARTESATALMARPRIKTTESLSGRVLSTGEPVVVEDLGQDTVYDPGHKKAAIEQGYRGFVGVPLKSRGRILGSLNIFTKGARHFLTDEIGLLAALADQASTAIEKARLFRETEEGRRLLARLYQAAIAMQTSWDRDDRLTAFVKAAHEIVGFDRVRVHLTAPGAAVLELVKNLGEEADPAFARLPLSPASGPFWEVVQTRRPIAALSDEDLARVAPIGAEYRHHPIFRSTRFVIAPLVVGERVIGVVSADNKPSRRPISPSSIEPFSSLCQSLAIALEESRLYAEATAREQEARTLSRGLGLLNQATRALHRTLEVEPMLARALEELAHALDADGAIVNLLDADGGAQRSIGHWVTGADRRELPVRKGGITDFVRDARAPVLLRDVNERLDLVHPVNLAQGVQSIAAFPIVSQQERVLGVLLLYYRTPQRFPDNEVRLLTLYADQLATALENARLYEETQTQRVRLAQIFASTSDGIVLVARSGEIQAANRRAGDLLGFNAAAVVGVGLAELLAGYRSSVPDYDRVFAALHALLDDPDRGGEGDLDLRRMGRIIHWVGRPTTDAAGGTIGFTLTLRDVTQERQVAQMKTDFVSFVTHQLRTPLSGIRWMLELAQEASGVPEEPLSYVQDARQAAERLIGLVNDLLDVSRLESGKLKLEPQPVNLGELTGSVLDDLGTLVREKGHRVAVEGAGAVPAVTADPQLLRQVILNLTSNAIKYTPPGGEVTIRMEVENGAVRWAIEDSGIGIPQGSRARLFEKFYRADNALTVETEGTGLGLYLVRLILEKFSGQVWCESEEGKGSTFVFTLPGAERGR
jgi:PAS domain S-box-containing protein